MMTPMKELYHHCLLRSALTIHLLNYVYVLKPLDVCSEDVYGMFWIGLEHVPNIYHSLLTFFA
jgi:hypothetical protein